jgi:hypothetical protein
MRDASHGFLFGTVLKSYLSKIAVMEMRKEGIEKRRRKMVSRAVLVRSVKPGQALSATYERDKDQAPIWKA